MMVYEENGRRSVQERLPEALHGSTRIRKGITAFLSQANRMVGASSKHQPEDEKAFVVVDLLAMDPIFFMEKGGLPLEKALNSDARTVEAFQELANSQEILAEITEPKPPTSSRKSQEVVLAFYEALKSRDVDTVHKILAHDLEWWFHGPPSHQFLMRLLTGEQNDNDVPFEFSPISTTSFGNIVVVEGCDTSRSISWVHAWTVTDGVITQVREYFNTSLTVTRLGNQSQPSDFKSKSKSSSTTEISPVHCPSVWESSLSDRIERCESSSLGSCLVCFTGSGCRFCLLLIVKVVREDGQPRAGACVALEPCGVFRGFGQRYWVERSGDRAPYHFGDNIVSYSWGISRAVRCPWDLKTPPTFPASPPLPSS
ncbi:hypothetical protein D5086_016048 [Populus alba]|uniref:Uncharacterized protein n=1 Tax=Populus alba TaxID=43335 RepID=A0ACC4BU50_POPAL